MGNARELISSGDQSFNTGRSDDAQALYTEAAAAAEREQDAVSALEAYAQLARLELMHNRVDQGKTWLEKAAAATPEQPLAWSRYLGVRGRFEWKEDRIDEALSTFKQMHEYCSGHKLYDRAVDATHMAAIVTPPEQQVEWARKGIAEAEAGELHGWLGPLWNNLGATYEDLGNLEEALKCYLQAREYHWRFGTERNKLIADWAVGHTYRKLGRVDEAGAWLRPVYAWCERIDDKEFLGWTSEDLGEIHAAQGDIQKALEYLRRARDLLVGTGIEQWDKAHLDTLTARIVEIESR